MSDASVCHIVCVCAYMYILQIPPGPSAFLVMHTSEDKEVPLRAEDDRARDQWMQKITKATLEFMTTKKKMDREKEEQCKLVLRLHHLQFVG